MGSVPSEGAESPQFDGPDWHRVAPWVANTSNRYKPRSSQTAPSPAIVCAGANGMTRHQYKSVVMRMALYAILLSGLVGAAGGLLGVWLTGAFVTEL